MRMVSYNILDGGVKRAEMLAEVILAQSPDIVALVEAGDDGVLDDLAKRLKMEKVQVRGNNAKHAAAILSNWPIRHTINHAALRPELTNSCLEAAIISPDGVEWIVYALHLHPRAFEEDECVREKEIAQVLQITAEHRRANRPHLLAGDFNSNAPLQCIDPNQCKPRTREAWEKNGGQVPRRVVQKILQAGYVDSLQAVHGEAAGQMTNFTTDHPGQRLDYIFVHGFAASALRDAWIERRQPAGRASDHFPIGIEIQAVGP